MVFTFIDYRLTSRGTHDDCTKPVIAEPVPSGRTLPLQQQPPAAPQPINTVQKTTPETSTSSEFDHPNHGSSPDEVAFIQPSHSVFESSAGKLSMSESILLEAQLHKKARENEEKTIKSNTVTTVAEARDEVEEQEQQGWFIDASSQDVAQLYQEEQIQISVPVNEVQASPFIATSFRNSIPAEEFIPLEKYHRFDDRQGDIFDQRHYNDHGRNEIEVDQKSNEADQRRNDLQKRNEDYRNANHQQSDRYQERKRPSPVPERPIYPNHQQENNFNTGQQILIDHLEDPRMPSIPNPTFEQLPEFPQVSPLKTRRELSPAIATAEAGAAVQSKWCQICLEKDGELIEADYEHQCEFHMVTAPSRYVPEVGSGDDDSESEESVDYGWRKDNYYKGRRGRGVARRGQGSNRQPYRNNHDRRGRNGYDHRYQRDGNNYDDGYRRDRYRDRR